MELKKKNPQQCSYGNDKGKDIDSSEDKAINRGARLSQEVVSLPSMVVYALLGGVLSGSWGFKHRKSD